MLVGRLRGAAAPGGPGQEAQLHEIRLVYVFQGDGLFSDGSGQGFQAHRAAAIVLNDGGEHAPVDGVQSQLIHLQPPQG